MPNAPCRPAASLALSLLLAGLQPFEAAAQVFRTRTGAPGRSLPTPAVRPVSLRGSSPLAAPSLPGAMAIPSPVAAPGISVRPAPAPSPAAEGAGALDILEAGQSQVQDLLQASAESASGAEDLSRGAALIFEAAPNVPGSDDTPGLPDLSGGPDAGLSPASESPAEAKTGPIEKLILSGRAQAGPPSRLRRALAAAARWTGAYALWTVYRDGWLTHRYAAQLSDQALPPARRMVSARLLAAVGRVDAIPALGFSAARDPEHRVRQAAVEGILSVAEKARPRLLQDLKSSRLGGRRENAARALGWIARFSEEPAVIRALADAARQDKKEDVRLTAIEALSTARSPEALAELASLRARETAPHGHSALETAYAKALRARTVGAAAPHLHEPPAGELAASKQPLYNTALKRVLAVGVVFLAVELVGSMMTGSLSLKADAMHMAADLSITAGALFAGWMSRRPPSSRKTFGYLKMEAVTGLLSSLAIAGMGVNMLLEAIPRLWAPVAVPGLTTILLALAGLASNAISTFILYRYRDESLSLKGAFLHAMTDAIGSVGIITAGLLMIYGGWFIADPLISFVIVGLIFHTTWDLAKRSWNVLIDAVPEGLDRDALEGDLLALEGVAGVHNLHVWSLNSTETIATAELHLKPGTDADKALKAAQAVLRDKYKIRRATVQIEFLGR